MKYSLLWFELLNSILIKYLSRIRPRVVCDGGVPRRHHRLQILPKARQQTLLQIHVPLAIAARASFRTAAPGHRRVWLVTRPPRGCRFHPERTLCCPGYGRYHAPRRRAALCAWRWSAAGPCGSLLQAKWPCRTSTFFTKSASYWSVTSLRQSGTVETDRPMFCGFSAAPYLPD